MINHKSWILCKFAPDFKKIRRYYAKESGRSEEHTSELQSIVESPAKAKTIEKFLGKDYKVMSSYGHIRDLKTKEFSIDIEHDYAPQYVIPADKKKLVSELKSEAKSAEQVWLASDEDRELALS